MGGMSSRGWERLMSDLRIMRMSRTGTRLVSGIVYDIDGPWWTGGRGRARNLESAGAAVRRPVLSTSAEVVISIKHALLFVSS